MAESLQNSIQESPEALKARMESLRSLWRQYASHERYALGSLDPIERFFVAFFNGYLRSLARLVPDKVIETVDRLLVPIEYNVPTGRGILIRRDPEIMRRLNAMLDEIYGNQGGYIFGQILGHASQTACLGLLVNYVIDKF